MKKLTAHLQSRYGISSDESMKVAFNVVIFALLACGGVVWWLFGVI